MIMDKAYCSFLCLILTLLVTPSVNAWITYNQNLTPTTRRQYRQHCVASQLHLRFLDKSNNDEPSLILTPDENKAIREAAKVVGKEDAFGVGWFEVKEAWAKVKKEYPILSEYEDSDLKDAYLKQKPNFLEVLIETPLGPVLLINLLVKFSGFTWCDTPFHSDAACPPL